ncbi:MAG: hypothetical protein RJA70_2337 [Pseudomonadota bacterium]|jgi:Dyp-type peroxidase family
MMTEATSKHLKTASELTLVADILPGLVGSTDVVSYAGRLGRLMATLFELRRNQVEAGSAASLGPLERLHSLYFVRWAILDGSKLLLAVSFDSPWETYIQAIVDDAGPLLDVIFCHCVGYEGCSSDKGYTKFAEWVRAHQVDVSFLYAAEPDLTAPDLDYLKRFYAASTQGKSAEDLVRLNVANVTPPLPDDGVVNATRLNRASSVLMDLESFFKDSDPAQRGFYRAAVWEVVRGLMSPALLDGKLVGGDVRKYVTGLEADANAKREAKARCPVVQAPVNLRKDVQGNILTGYPRMTHGCLVLLGFDSGHAARAFLREHASRMTLDADSKQVQVAANIALTLQGLRTLGLSEQELQVLPKEFREGMQARAPMLGDVGTFHPNSWKLPRTNWHLGATLDQDSFEIGARVPLETVDLVLQIQLMATPIKDDHLWSAQHPAYGELRGLVANHEGVRVMHVQPLRREYWCDGDSKPSEMVREHFGFKDGLSQPIPQVEAATAKRSGDDVPLGEVLLGYPGTRGECYPPAEPPVFLRNGSFLVVRKLEQHVGAFNTFLSEGAAAVSDKPGLTEDQIASKLMGRARNGDALVPLQSADANDFDYESDKAGDACPLASHARRCNPRTSPRQSLHGHSVPTPRILRRGFSFGPSAASGAEGERGLMFLAYNASIAQQFEVVQRWVNGGNSTGLLSAQNDPIVGAFRGQQEVSFIHEGQAVRFTKREPFVSVRWGLYSFAPSLSGLHALSQWKTSKPTKPSPRAREGEAILGRLKKLEHLAGSAAPGTSRVDCQAPGPSPGCEWKKLLEDRAAKDKATSVWAAIRESHSGVLRTPYGVLVGDAELVERVLADETVYSVRRYWERMRQSVGPLYLGMDRSPCPMPSPSPDDKAYEAAVVPGGEGYAGTYTKESQAPNDWIRGVGVAEAFQSAKVVASVVLNKLLETNQAALGERGFDVRVFAAGVVSALSRQWFGFPNDALPFESFRLTGLNVFYPHPDPSGVVAKVTPLSVVFQAALALPPAEIPFEVALRNAGKTEAQIKQDALGATQGFVVPTMSSLASVLVQWIDDQQLWRMGQWLQTKSARALLGPVGTVTDDALLGSVLFRRMIRSLREQPVPGMLHRKATAKAQLGNVEIVPGDTVVVSLSSAMAGGAPWQLLFGEGSGGPGKPVQVPIHACPGRDMALGVMLGSLVALLERVPNLERATPVGLREQRP